MCRSLCHAVILSTIQVTFYRRWLVDSTPHPSTLSLGILTSRFTLHPCIAPENTPFIQNIHCCIQHIHLYNPRSTLCSCHLRLDRQQFPPNFVNTCIIFYRELSSVFASSTFNIPSNKYLCRLERIEPGDRRGIVSRIREGCSPLFIACKRGNVEIVEYLMSLCNADLEQRGLYEVQDDRWEYCFQQFYILSFIYILTNPINIWRSVHNVTPLWCASVAGKYRVVDVLVK